MELELRRISVVGLGKLGLPLAACFAWRGFATIGLDVDSSKLQAVRQGVSTIYEPRLQEIMQASGGRLAATDDYEKTVMDSDVTFIIVPTPSEAGGGFSLQYVLEAAQHLGDALRKKSAYHLVVLTSTVLPGSTDKELKPLLEKRSGKQCIRDFGLCYNPEFVALGSVIHNLLNPDFILIGESDAQAGSMLAGLYKRFCANNPPVARMNFVNAELTKLSLNTYVTTKISFANTLARICERLPGADVNIVTAALGLDSRIGGRYLKGAVGYGGPCFPRDNLALANFSRSVNVPATLAEATDVINRQQVQWLLELIKGYLPPEGKVGILGLAYKPHSDVVEEAQGLLLAQALVKEGIGVIAFDPVAMDNARQVLDTSVTLAVSLQECIQKTEVVVVITPWEEFKQVSSKEFSGHKRPCVLIDCWRILERMEQVSDIIYVPLGIGSLNTRR